MTASEYEASQVAWETERFSFGSTRYVTNAANGLLGISDVAWHREENIAGESNQCSSSNTAACVECGAMAMGTDWAGFHNPALQMSATYLGTNVDRGHYAVYTIDMGGSNEGKLLPLPCTVDAPQFNPGEHLRPMISEWAEGSTSSRKYLEIFNPNDFSIPLKDFAIARTVNAPETAGLHEDWDQFPDWALLPARGVYTSCSTLSTTFSQGMHASTRTARRR